MDATLDIVGETLTLLPERAVFWGRERMLLIADPHFGKSATFRAYGIPIPEGSLNADLARLTQAVERTGALELVVLGDLLHHAQGRDHRTLATVQAWRETYSKIHITLVRGNHDHHAGDPPAEWSVQCVDAPALRAPIALSHFPGEVEAGYGLAGHVHPLAEISGKGKQRLKLPCFWFGKNVGVLPAFGSFIDGAIVRPQLGDRVFVIAGEQVLDIRRSPAG